MGDSKGSGFPDNSMLAGITPLKDASADPFSQVSVSSRGWDVMRFTSFSLVEGAGRRFWHRDKENSFRPRVAPLYQEQVNYRNFQDTEGGGESPPSTPTGGGGGVDTPTPTAPAPSPTGGLTVVGRDAPTNQNFESRRQEKADGEPGFTAPVGIPGGSGGVGPGVIGPGGGVPVGIPGGTGVGPGVIGPGNVVPVGISGPPEPTGKKKAPGAYDVGYEMSLVADIFGKIKKSPSWQPSNINSPNRGTLVLSRHELDGSDKDDIDLAPRYFGRTQDLFAAIPTQEVKLQRVRFKGGNSHFKKSESSETYTDGIFKNALNITPIDKPIDGGIDQKTEEDSGPGEEGFANHKYIPGFPDPKVDEPDIFPQGGIMFDARQVAFASFQDIIGIDAIENEQAKLPRYTARFKWKAGIAYIRHDAHFNKEGDDECPPPIGQGIRKSGRILFTDVEE